MRENTDQKNSGYGEFSRSDDLSVGYFPLVSLSLLKFCPDELSIEHSNFTLMQLEIWFSYFKFSAGL